MADQIKTAVAQHRFLMIYSKNSPNIQQYMMNKCLLTIIIRDRLRPYCWEYSLSHLCPPLSIDAHFSSMSTCFFFSCNPHTIWPLFCIFSLAHCRGFACGFWSRFSNGFGWDCTFGLFCCFLSRILSSSLKNPDGSRSISWWATQGCNPTPFGSSPCKIGVWSWQKIYPGQNFPQDSSRSP